eukprot:scaffold304163_cov53-Prasinocladus_malaysianus.AAC.1
MVFAVGVLACCGCCIAFALEYEYQYLVGCHFRGQTCMVFSAFRYWTRCLKVKLVIYYAAHKEVEIDEFGQYYMAHIAAKLS